MPTAVESAHLILKLYELRREETMRKARDFMLSFDPRTLEDVQSAYIGPESGYIRMVTGYWEMAASFVISGAIDSALFNESNGEHIVAFGKVQPFLPQLREMFGNPNFMKSLEEVCINAPGGLERVTATRERLRHMMTLRAASAAKA